MAKKIEKSAKEKAEAENLETAAAESTADSKPMQEAREESKAAKPAEGQATRQAAEAVPEQQYVPETGKKAVHAQPAGQDGDYADASQVSAGEGDIYLNAGAHIGTRFKSGDMRRYIYKVRKDGLKVLDVKTLDERLRLAAKFVAGYPKEKIVVVARRAYGQTPARSFVEAVGGMAVTSRFVPGTFTNPQCTHFVEPAVVIAVDPEVDNQAIEEATNIRVPVIAMASTNNSLKNVDLAIPINNKGKKSLALGFWVLARETLKARGDIKDDSEFAKKPEDFEYKLKEGEEEEQKRAYERRQMTRTRFGDRPRRFGGSESRGPSFGRRRFD